MHDFYFGTDPELIALDNNGLLPPVAAQEFYGLQPVGVKSKPRHDGKSVEIPVYFDDGDITIEMDGALFESTISPSQSSEELFEKLEKVRSTIRNIGKVHGFEISSKPLEPFNSRYYLETINNPLINDSIIAGCDPDEDAMDDEYVPEVRDLTRWEYRGAGGHVHVSSSSEEFQGRIQKVIRPMVHIMAITVGCASVYTIKTSNLEAERERKRVFGSAGKYRLQKYPSGMLGVEYRTPSNGWIFNQDSIDLIFRAANQAVDLFHDKDTGNRLLHSYAMRATDAITELDVEECKSILKEIELL